MVSIIIPSLNSPIIHQVVVAILQQSCADAISEVLIVGRDEARLIPENSRVQLIDTEVPVPPAKARNIGIQASGGTLLVFLDSDCLPQPGWLAGHLEAHKVGHHIVGGGVMPAGSNYWHLSYNLTMFHETFSTNTAGKRDYFPTLNLSIDRQVIDEVGLLNETLERAQDIEWTTRMREAGYQPYFCPKAAVFHQHNRSKLLAVWRDCARSGYYMRQVRLTHNDALQAPSILRYRGMVLLLSPGIAAWATWRILRTRPSTFRVNWRTIPAIYLTKLAWCWGASRANPPQ